MFQHVPTTNVKNFVEKHFHNDAYELTTGGDFLQVFTTVEKVELMVKSQYHHYTHVNGKTTVIRLAGEYEMPNEIAEHVDFIGPSHRFPLVQSLKLGKTVSSPDETVTPDVLKKMHEF